MADETATISDNTTEPTEQATTPTPAPTPASAPKPHAPSPAAFAKKAVKRPAPAASASGYSDTEVKAVKRSVRRRQRYRVRQGGRLRA